jgi:hypothetical protein
MSREQPRSFFDVVSRRGTPGNHVALVHIYAYLRHLCLLGRPLNATLRRRVGGAGAGNAETNDHMIAINDALGYQVFGPRVRSWQLPAADAARA